MKKVILLTLGFAGLVFTACKKEKEKAAAPTTQELLTSTSWKYDTITLDLDKNGTPDATVPTGYVESCDLDNTITFNSDMTGVNDEGATKCDDSDPQTTPFTWSLSNNDSTLNISGNTDTQLNGTIAIQEISDTKMVLVKNIIINDVITIDANVIVTLKK